MHTLRFRIKRPLALNCNGQGIVEYTLIVLLVAIVFWLGIRDTQFGQALQTAWNDVGGSISSMAGQPGSDAGGSGSTGGSDAGSSNGGSSSGGGTGTGGSSASGATGGTSGSNGGGSGASGGSWR